MSKALAGHLKASIQWKQSVGQGTDRTVPLFVGRRGPLSAPGLQQIFKTAMRRAGLPQELSIHCCRQTVPIVLPSLRLRPK